MKLKALSDAFSSDRDAEENGRFMDVADGIQFQIRRARSKAVTDARKRIYGPYERAMKHRDELPPELEVKLTIDLLSQAVITGWRRANIGDDAKMVYSPMTDDDGIEQPFSSELVASLLRNPDYGKDLRQTVIILSSDGDMFRPEEAAEDKGNFSAS